MDEQPEQDVEESRPSVELVFWITRIEHTPDGGSRMTVECPQSMSMALAALWEARLLGMVMRATITAEAADLAAMQKGRRKSGKKQTYESATPRDH